MISPETLAAAMRVNQYAARRAMLAARADSSDVPGNGALRLSGLTDDASAHVSAPVLAALASAQNPGHHTEA